MPWRRVSASSVHLARVSSSRHHSHLALGVVPAKSRIKGQGEALRTVAYGLRTAAVRPSIHGYRPHEKQTAFHRSPAPVRGLFGGNRSGKTVSGATEGVFRAIGRSPFQHVPPPPTRGRVVAVDFINGVNKIVLPEIARWLPPSELSNGSWEDSYDKQMRTLTLANQSTIEFMSYEQETDAFAGTSRHWVWLDEEPPRDIYVECSMRLLDTRGKLWMTMTPLEGMTWVYDEVYLKAKVDPRFEIWEVDITDNPHLNQVEIEALLSGLTEEEREARAHGKFVQIGGLIYPMFGQRHILDPFIPPADWLHVAGMDHGFHNPTAWLWSAIDPDGNMVVYDEYYKAGQIVRYHASRVHEINIAHERQPDYYVGDPSIRNVDPITGTSIHIEYINHGIPIVLGNNDVHAGIDAVARMLTGMNGRPKLYFTRNCVNSIHEHGRYRWAKWAHRKQNEQRNKKEEPVKKDDHTCDTIRYIVASRPMYDKGTSIPEKHIPVGASVAESPYDVATAPVERSAPEGDYHLGEEY